MVGLARKVILMGTEGSTHRTQRKLISMEDARIRENAESTPLLLPNHQPENDSSKNDGIIPQLLTSLPDLNEAASYVTQKTSLLTGCFSANSVDPDSENHDAIRVKEKMIFSSEHDGGSLSNAYLTLSESQPMALEVSNTVTPPIQDGISRTSAGDSSVNSNLRIESNNSFNTTTATPPTHDGISRTSAGDSSENSNLHIESNNSFNTTPIDTPIQDEIALSTVKDSSERSPLLGESNVPSRNGLFRGLVERARRTVRGSADDIGWLQRDTDMPPVEDGTERFNEILENIRHGIHILPKSMVYLLIPGLFSNHGPLYFVNAKTSFSKMGLTCHIAKIHSEASVEKNARELKEYIEEMYWGSQKRVVLLGHSKGGVDAAAALSMYWPDLKDKVAGIALAQSPYGGSPIASDILRVGQLGDYVNVRKLMEILICKVIKGDMQALEDLTYEKRREFLKKNCLPRELAVVSFHTEASTNPSVLAALSRVAHAELPLVPSLTSGPPAKLPVVMPLGAVMAACAQLLQSRYGEKSDGLVTRRDAEVPGSLVVRPKRKLDHAWMVYSSLNDDPLEADASQVCEALLTMLVEVGEQKKHT